MVKSFLVLLLFFTVYSAPHRRMNVTINGSVNDCFKDSVIHIPGVSVAAFDVAANRELVDSLGAMDAVYLGDSATVLMPRLESQYNRVIDLVQNSTALARTTADANGSFEFSIEPADSVVVFGSYDAEDEPFPYGYKVIGAQVSGSIVIDTSRGGCNYVTH